MASHYVPDERERHPYPSPDTTSRSTAILRLGDAYNQDQRSHPRAEFGLVLGRTKNSKVGGGHESSLGLGEIHDRFVDVQVGEVSGVKENICLARLVINMRTGKVCGKPHTGSLIRP